jgi:hypothetical protein
VTQAKAFMIKADAMVMANERIRKITKNFFEKIIANLFLIINNNIYFCK